ncbi:MAG: hypothetical protein H6R05_892 [Burkholderiaceae bacterium]|nr:hypothetical protein [Burkholderiaceae bacterium]
MRHILLQKALTYKKRRELETPAGFSFNSALGAWVNNIDKSLLIFAKDFKALASKKEDIETGEDKKGQ